MLVSFLTPSWMLVNENEPPTVSMLLQSSTQSLMMFSSVLGIQLNIFQTSLADETDVFVTAERPNLGPTIFLPQPSLTAEKSSVKMTAHMNQQAGCITSFTGHADIVSDATKAALQAGGTVEIEQTSPSQVTAVIDGKHHVRLEFPVPVVSSNSKTRIARKSAYIEVIAPVLQSNDHNSLAAFMHPILLEEGFPVSLNMPRAQLDGMAIVDTSQPSKLGWMHTHTSLMFSERENVLRKASMALHAPTTPDLRINFKDSLFSIFTRFVGGHGGAQQVERGRIFGICDPKNGGLHILIVASALRLDGANGSVVLDAAAIPITINVGKYVGPWLSSLREAIVSINVDEEELKLWKRSLPAYAERCRTWSHKVSCEYVRKNSIPLSMELGKSPLCSCGSGVFPANFMQNPKTRKFLPKWDTVSRFAVRVAISPAFSVPMVEEQAGSKNLKPDVPNKQSDKNNPELEVLSNLIGDKDKMRALQETVERMRKDQGDSFDEEAAIKKAITEILKTGNFSGVIPNKKPKPAPKLVVKELSEMEALEKAMQDLVDGKQ